MPYVCVSQRTEGASEETGSSVSQPARRRGLTAACSLQCQDFASRQCPRPPLDGSPSNLPDILAGSVGTEVVTITSKVSLCIFREGNVAQYPSVPVTQRHYPTAEQTSLKAGTRDSYHPIQ